MTVAISRRQAGARSMPHPGAVIMAFLRRDWAISWSYRLPFALGLLQIVLSLGFLYFLSRLVGPRIGVTDGALRGGYFAYVVLGTTLLSIFSVNLTAFAQRLRTDQTTGTLEVLFTMPPRASLVVLASASYQITYALVVGGLTVAIAVGFGMRFDTSAASVLVGLAALVASLVLFAATGVAFAGFVVVFKRAETITALASAALSLLAGVYYPVQLMPHPLRVLAEIIPFTWALQVMRGALLGAQLPLARLGELALAAAALLPVAMWLFSVALDRARRSGTLGQY
jgi:ABC-2 type transport system permease protein